MAKKNVILNTQISDDSMTVDESKPSASVSFETGKGKRKKYKSIRARHNKSGGMTIEGDSWDGEKTSVADLKVAKETFLKAYKAILQGK